MSVRGACASLAPGAATGAQMAAAPARTCSPSCVASDPAARAPGAPTQPGEPVDSQAEQAFQVHSIGQPVGGECNEVGNGATDRPVCGGARERVAQQRSEHTEQHPQPEALQDEAQHKLWLRLELRGGGGEAERVELHLELKPGACRELALVWMLEGGAVSKPYGVLSRGGKLRQSTFPGHRWALVDEVLQKVVKVLVATAGPVQPYLIDYSELAAGAAHAAADEGCGTTQRQPLGGSKVLARGVTETGGAGAQIQTSAAGVLGPQLRLPSVLLLF